MKTTKTREHSAFIENPVFHLAVIVMVGLIAYCNTLNSPFEFDDYQSLLELPYVQDLRWLFDTHLLSEFLRDQNFNMRFMGILTFALNYAIHGERVLGYHLANITIHLVNAMLVFHIVRLTLTTYIVREKNETREDRDAAGNELLPWVPLFAALLFVAHPIQTQAVTYIVQRLASLAALFTLSCVLFYILFRRMDGVSGRPSRKWSFYALAVISSIFAMKTKENTFTLPVVICLYEMMFFSGEWRKRILRLVPLLLTMAIIPLSLMIINWEGGSFIGGADNVTRVTSDLSRLEYLFTQFRVIVTYLRLLILPINQNLLYDYPEYRSFFAPAVFFSFILLAALLLLASYLYYVSARNRTTGNRNTPLNVGLLRMIAFGIFWFFITLSVESSVIPINDVIFEHRLYLPSVGAFTAFAASLVIISRKIGGRSRWAHQGMIVLGAVVVISLAWGTHERNEVWSSQASLWQDVVDKSPGKAGGYQNLGIALYERGETARAFAVFERAIEIDPESAVALTNRGNIYARSGDMVRAILDLERSLSIYPDNAIALSNLGLAYSEIGRHQAAIPLLKRAIALKSTYIKAYNNMGLVLIRMGRPLEAVSYLDRALEKNANYDLAWFNRGVARNAAGDPILAVADLNRAIALRPGFAAAYFERGVAKERSGNRDEAAKDFSQACGMGDRRGCLKLEKMGEND